MTNGDSPMPSRVVTQLRIAAGRLDSPPETYRRQRTQERTQCVRVNR